MKQYRPLNFIINKSIHTCHTALGMTRSQPAATKQISKSATLFTIILSEINFSLRFAISLSQSTGVVSSVATRQCIALYRA